MTIDPLTRCQPTTPNESTVPPNEQMCLSRKKVLVIGEGFHDYDTLIASSITQLGGQTTLIKTCPGIAANVYAGPLIRKFPAVQRAMATAQEKTNISLLTEKHFDIILALKGSLLSPHFLAHMKTANPNARWILYQWDSLSNLKNFETIHSTFDKCFTFDKADAAKNPTMHFRPLFYIPTTSPPPPIPSGVLFVGMLHSSRYQFLEKIQEALNPLSVPFRVELLTTPLGYFRTRRRTTALPLRIKPVPYSDYQRLLAECEAVVDMPAPNQSGLTMRTIEAIGMSKKVITTNANIKSYPFYSEKNICVVNHNAPSIPSGFLNNSAAKYDTKTVEKYSIYQWLKDVLL